MNWTDKLKHHQSTLLGIENYKKYAVCIPLIFSEEGCKVLFAVRASHIAHQPGDICFPGGKIEAGETPEQAAVRETMEELLIEEEQLEMYGLMDVLLNGTSQMIYPFASELKEYQGTWSNDEVETTFVVPLDYFLNTEPELFYTRVESIPEEDFPFDRIHDGKKYSWRKSRNEIYFYSYEGHEIWGLTAKIMKSFVDIIRKSASSDLDEMQNISHLT